MSTSESLWLLYFTSKCSAILSPENITFFLLSLCFVWLSFSLLSWSYPGGHAWGKYYLNNWNYHYNTIPGPRGFPIIGNMNLMSSSLAHQRLESVADSTKAKRIMAFSLGETRAIVTCNPDVAKEILNSSVFADRPIKQSAYSLMFNQAIGFAPFGLYWRTLRKVSATHVFSRKQIVATEAQRQKIADQMVSVVASLGKDNEFEVRDILKRASLNNMMCLVFGREYDLSDNNNNNNKELDELSELVHEGYELLGQLNWADHLPWLAFLDLQKIRRRCSKLVLKVNQFVSRIITEHRVAQSSSNLTGPRKFHDFVDVLLSLSETNYKLSDLDTIAILWEMIFRGTDAIAILIEWILARVVLHQDIQSKMHEELDEVVGKKQPVKESDIPSLTYLQAVIKEVLRLHPPGPLLSWARLAITDTIIDGH
uniref:Cytochrome P450 5316 n=1 Tax=Calotropis gigantea TaxID=4066 RepID=A0A977P3F8_CALGI|nr:cytochrome P450 5316 [Calotropis gigantea]